jgi:hypothetical protein
MVVINGSFARREASSGSDIDFSIVTCEAGSCEPAWAKAVREAIAAIVPVAPAEDGAFARAEHIETLISNIGGDQDDNAWIFIPFRAGRRNLRVFESSFRRVVIE